MDQNQTIDNEMNRIVAGPSCGKSARITQAAAVCGREVIVCNADLGDRVDSALARLGKVTAALDQFEADVTEAELPEIIAQLDSLEFMTSLVIAKRLWRRFRDSLVKQPGWMEWFKKNYKAINIITIA